MAGIACLGALVAGGYGVLHDQITYTISPEYFTKLKSAQFAYANFGFPTRVFVAEIGFLATWWVGLFSGWFLARIALPVWPIRKAFHKCLKGFTLIFVLAAGAGVFGYLLALLHSRDYSDWQEMTSCLDIQDVPAFVRVAYIHAGGYIGGLAGLLISLGWSFHQKKLSRQ